MIKIGTPFITTENERAKLHAPVTIPDDTAKRYVEETDKLINIVFLTKMDYPPAHWKEDGTVWFSVSAEYRDYLCCERSDAFIIAFLWYAMITGSDICFEVPVSKKLYEGLTQQLIPALAKGGYRAIKLTGPVSNEEIWHKDGVVTGMTCGVDSLYTLLCYGTDRAPEGMRLTHLAYYDGNYILPDVRPPYDTNELYRKMVMSCAPDVDKARMTAANNGLPLIDVMTNLDKDYYRGGLPLTGMYRFLSCTLALAHLYGTYISSSSGHTETEEISLFAPTQHYENLICKTCGTDTLKYVSSDCDSRCEKLRALADNADAQKYLEVCFDPEGPEGNCGACYGCWKTMIPLDIMGKLGNFAERFDLDMYYADRKKVFADLIGFSKRPEASSARDSVRQFAELAEQEQSEAGREFLEVLSDIDNIPVYEEHIRPDD